ncbi:MAG: DNA-binding protein [Pseudomonadales bacterium]|nr:DNA-binding protein [Pseudomonadales bacterium]
MKVKPEIKEKILAAANALVAEGNENPTNEKVREKMGSGSLSHISPVMREWRDSRKDEMVAALEIPAELKKAIETSLSQVWTASSKLATATVEKIKQEAQANIDVAANERDEALEEITRLETRINDQAAQDQEKTKALGLLKSDLDAAQELIAKLHTDMAALSVKAEYSHQQVKELKAELKSSKEDNKSLQAELLAIAKKGT